MEFEINFPGHEVHARYLLLKKKIKTSDELALMTSCEVERAVNDNFEAFESGDSWILVPKDKLAEFNNIIYKIGR